MRKFITFEGGEGTGKSTQAKLLSISLNKIGEENILTREPGGTPLSEKIRRMIVNHNNDDMLVDTELLLIYAGRHDHLQHKIIPALKKKNVICDRYIHSTLCYQNKSSNLKDKIKFIHKYFADDLMPDITFLLDLPPEEGIKRSLKIKKKETKFEMKNLKFHKEVRNRFLQLQKKNKKMLKVDGSLSIKDVHTKIIDHLNDSSLFKKNLTYTVI